MICLQTIKSAVCLLFFHDNVAQNNSGFFVLFIFFITPKRKNYNIFSEIFECCSQFWVSLKERASRFYNFLKGCLDNFQMICCTIIPIKTAKMVNPKTITAALWVSVHAASRWRKKTLISFKKCSWQITTTTKSLFKFQIQKTSLVQEKKITYMLNNIGPTWGHSFGCRYVSTSANSTSVSRKSGKNCWGRIGSS